jgi:hypothetical protein
VSIMDNNQQADGSVGVPVALQAGVGGAVLEPVR